ncbi:MAG: peptidoglycan-binding protein, partial [Catenulispora sp.]|nr:peptidoglycan-binding protein [Catenulispora sp.]
GGSGAPAAAPGSSATEVVTPTNTPSASSPATSGEAPPTTSSAPTTTAPSTAPHPPGTLALGVTGNDVKWLQARLKQLHLYNGEISGTFDAATQAAVVAFQNRAHTADPSGVVGRSTRTALIAAGSKPQVSLLTGGEHHGKGANPEDVKRLQRSLASALNKSVKATGQFDMDTFSALVEYQAAEGLAPDGIAGDKVWSALQQGKIVG